MSYSLQIQEAKTVYKDKEGHQFGFDHCWTLLRFQQKWMVEHKKIEATRIFKAPTKNQISINLEDDNGNAPEPAPLKRPIGRKAAKEANKKTKSNEQGDDDEKESSKVRSELEEFRARRLESDRVKAEQLKLLINIEQKQVALREKEIELQARSEETKIMSMDTSSMNPIQAEYFISLQREILAKRAGKNGNE
ncbi:uncharacterized protein LOC109843727 [Asparagus officinalis]|uniref:uncharacterized protein LOC109843727 n=1 Tax=Asparagus officinalis TaxID=4686 RepID=UPI00098E7138|nr:uncharacterized protein LOC109843727 [Asparagus officinalis]